MSDIRDHAGIRSQVEQLLGQFDAKTLTRRELVASRAALAAGATTGTAAPSTPAAQGKTHHHSSIAVPDGAKLLGLKVVSRPGNGGINLGLSDGFLGLYKLANPGTPHHFCIGVDDYEPDKIAARLQAMGIKASVDRNPRNRTSGGDQLYFNDPDGTRVQLSANGYQG